MGGVAGGEGRESTWAPGSGATDDVGAGRLAPPHSSEWPEQGGHFPDEVQGCEAGAQLALSCSSGHPRSLSGACLMGIWGSDLEASRDRTLWGRLGGEEVPREGSGPCILMLRPSSYPLLSPSSPVGGFWQ